jgi:hypothetical protein
MLSNCIGTCSIYHIHKSVKPSLTKELKEDQGARRSSEEASITNICFDVFLFHLLIDHLVFPHVICV